MARKVVVTLNLDRDQKEALDKASDALLIPRAVLYRKGVDLAIHWAEERLRTIEAGRERFRDESTDERPL